MYDDKRMYQWDNENAFEYAEEKGRNEGRAEGIQEGEVKKALTVGSTMKNLGYPIPEIARITGLSIEQIENL